MRFNRVYNAVNTTFALSKEGANDSSRKCGIYDLHLLHVRVTTIYLQPLLAFGLL